MKDTRSLYENDYRDFSKKTLKATKYIGSLIGLAVGDALGAPVEFLPRDTFERIEYYRSGGKFNVAPGEYTDDTAMALCLAQSLIDCRGCDQKDQLNKYLRWFEKGYMSATGRSIGCGKTVLRALQRFQLKDCAECGNSRLRRGAGNGSLMRIAPVALYYADAPETAMKMAEKSSYTTHGLKICADACRLYTGLIIGALQGRKKKELLREDYFEILCAFDEKYRYDDEIRTVMQGSYRSKSRNEIKSGGYVVDTLEAALWAFYRTDSFDEGLLLAVNLGFDADTVGAVYGQLAGAYYDYDGIDKKFLEGILGRERIVAIALQLYKERFCEI